MRRVLAATLVLLLLATLAPQAEAAINRPKGFHESFGYMDGLDDPQMTVVSGDLEATTVRATGSYGFFDSAGATISGLTRVCYGNSCPPAGQYSLVVAPTAGTEGGSFAICFPSASGGELEAGHALTLFVDFRNDEDLNSFGVDKSLVAPAVDGRFRFTSIPAVTSSGNPTAACTQHGGVTALDDTTRITLLRGGQSITSLTGKSARFSFTGTAQVTDIDAGFYIVPFNGDGEARFGKAGAGDAKEGLDLARVQDLIAKLDQAHAGSTVDRTPAESGGDNTQEMLAGLLNGALLRVTGGADGNDNISLDGARFVRFSTLTVAGGQALDWDGKAYLDIDDGKVAGAKPLLGFWLFKLPWWSYLLWVIAIALAVIRLVTKPDKNHPVWDRFRWIGWVATPVAWILVFFLWDLEVHAALGASLLRDSSGQFRLIVGLLQLALMGIIGLCAAGPLRIIGRNTALLAHQGTFMGLAGSVAAILGYLFTAPYVRAYLGLVLGKVMESIG